MKTVIQQIVKIANFELMILIKIFNQHPLSPLPDQSHGSSPIPTQTYFPSFIITFPSHISTH